MAPLLGKSLKLLKCFPHQCLLPSTELSASLFITLRAAMPCRLACIQCDHMLAYKSSHKVVKKWPKISQEQFWLTSLLKKLPKLSKVWGTFIREFVLKAFQNNPIWSHWLHQYFTPSLKIFKSQQIRITFCLHFFYLFVILFNIVGCVCLSFPSSDSFIFLSYADHFRCHLSYLLFSVALVSIFCS